MRPSEKKEREIERKDKPFFDNLYHLENELRKKYWAIKDNHKLVGDTLPWLLQELSDHKIDYYLVGALPCYLLTGEKSIRYHDDIDIMLNEEDIEKNPK